MCQDFGRDVIAMTKARVLASARLVEISQETRAKIMDTFIRRNIHVCIYPSDGRAVIYLLHGEMYTRRVIDRHVSLYFLWSSARRGVGSIFIFLENLLNVRRVAKTYGTIYTKEEKL